MPRASNVYVIVGRDWVPIAAFTVKRECAKAYNSIHSPDYHVERFKDGNIGRPSTTLTMEELFAGTGIERSG